MMVHPDSHRVSRALWYSGTPCAAVRFRLPDFHRLWSAIPDGFGYLITDHVWKPYNPRGPKSSGLAYSPFARRYLGNLN